jgi:RNA methyltransferase, TrmH family
MTSVIRSRDNALLKRIVRLAEHGRFRRDEGTGLAEGWHLIRALLEAPGFGREALQAVALSESVLGHRDAVEMRGLLDGVPIHVIDSRVFGRIGESDGPNAAIGLFTLPPEQDAATLVSQGGLQLWLDAVQDPGNVGALIRTAAAAGATAVVLGTGCADAWSPRVLRAGMGGHFALRVVSTPLDAQLVTRFPGSIVAMERDGGASLFSVPLPEDCAFLLGNEGAGLSPQVAALADSRVTIPMAGRVESLNVAAAGAVICFEVLRRRLA